MLLGRPSAAGFRQVLKMPEARRWPTSQVPAAIEKVIALQDIPIFSRATAEQLLELAAAARPKTLTPGETLCNEADQGAIYIILSGGLSLKRPDATDAARARGRRRRCHRRIRNAWGRSDGLARFGNRFRPGLAHRS